MCNITICVCKMRRIISQMVDPSAGFGQLPLEIMVEMISALCSKLELQGDAPSNWNWSVPLTDAETVRIGVCFTKFDSDSPESIFCLFALIILEHIV